MARIYTRTGDGGETALFGGQRVPKSDPRVDVYGGVDELNCAMGVARAQIAAEATLADSDGQLKSLLPLLDQIQAELFEIGGVLASPERSEQMAAESAAESASECASASPFATTDLERAIDRLENDLTPLKTFILPGGSVVAAQLHLVRTVCRRVERQAVATAAETTVPPQVVVYLNRLSDFLFVAARWANHGLGIEDVAWQPRT